MHEHQTILHNIQKSPEGYDVGIYLLSLSSTTCQYFGALTLTVVLNLPDLDSPKCQRLVSDVLSHIRILALDPENISKSLFVIRKLMSNISLAYLKYHKTFSNPILSFAQILSPNPSMSIGAQDFTSLVTKLSPSQLTLMLIFFSVLIEDISKSNDFRAAIHTAVRENLYPHFLTTYQYLTYLWSLQQMLQELDSQALLTLHSWMLYIPNINGDARYDEVSDLVKFLSLHFENVTARQKTDSLDSIAKTLTTFNEILELNPNLLSHEEKQALYATVLGPWGTSFVDEVVLNHKEDYEEEITAFVDLVLTILQLNLIRLSKSILDTSTQSILGLAIRLTAAEGVPFVDESISERMLIFWEEFASVYQDSEDVFDVLFETQSDPNFQTAFEGEKRRIFDTVASIYWRKLHLPELQMYEQIRSEFNAYRSNVADFFLVVYSLLKSDFYRLMSESLIEASADLNSRTVLDVEATMYILYKINDDAVYFESQALLLTPFASQIFESGLLSKFKTFKADDSTNYTMLATLVQFCSSNVFYFKTENGSKHLGDVLEIVFPLVLSNEHTALALLASKTAMRICEECSKCLISILPDLESIVIGMLNNPEIDSLIRLRMFNAFSVIARSIRDVQEHGKILSGMVSAIANAASLAIRSSDLSENLLEKQEDYLSSLLSCLVNIAKGSSLSDDEIDEMLEQDQIAYREFWLKDPFGVKHIVLSIVQEFSLSDSKLAQNTIFVEKCTLILKAGLGEKLGGGFDVGNDAIIQFLMSLMEVTSNPNSVPLIFGLAECLVSTEYQILDPTLVQQLVQSLFTNKLSFLKTDPDMIKSAIDLFSKLLECKPSLILHTDIFSTTILQFAVEGLAANELFVVKSILRFWASILSLRRGTSDDHAECQRIFTEMNVIPIVTSRLVSSFVGAARSNLEYYYMIFRGMIGKFPVQFKNSLLNTLNDETLVRKIGIKELDLFVHKLMVTRGRRTANDVLKLFWLAANGFVEYNTQKI